MTAMPERRRYPRFTASLPLRLTKVAGKIESAHLTLLTQNISRAGVCFPAPRRIEPGEIIEVTVTLLGSGPGGKDVQVSGAGRVVRVEPCSKPGWYKLAATFGEPPAGEEPGWHKLAAAFDEPPSPATNS
jgi:hypothetical protein